jgi:hypothetical protein
MKILSEEIFKKFEVSEKLGSFIKWEISWNSMKYNKSQRKPGHTFTHKKEEEDFDIWWQRIIEQEVQQNCLNKSKLSKKRESFWKSMMNKFRNVRLKGKMFELTEEQLEERARRRDNKAKNSWNVVNHLD